MNAGGVITAARDRHPAFDRRRNPDGVLLRALSSYVRELHGKMAAYDPDALRTEVEIPLPLVDHEAGITLPANRYVAAAAVRSATQPNATQPIQIIPVDARADYNSPVLAGWQSGDKLFLRSPASAWQGYGTIGIALISVPITLTALDDVLPVPDTAELACVEHLALIMARRGHMDERTPALNVREFAEIARDAEQSFLNDVMNRLGGRTHRVRDVWQPGGEMVWSGERRWSP